MLDHFKDRQVSNPLRSKVMIDWKLKDTIFVLFPNAEICTDLDGQVIIYTGEQMDKVFLSPKDR
jgi:hypothetical protein